MPIFAALITFVGYALALIALGLAVGFSPTLYITQVGILTRGQHPLRQSALLIAGVASAVVLLALFSDIVQPAVLFSYTHDVLLTVTAERWFDYVFGAVFILTGLYYVHIPPKPQHPKKPAGSATTSLYVFGLIKTMFSASGFAALLLGTRLIKELTDHLTMQLLLFSTLLSAAALPFAGLLLLHMHRPHTFSRLNRLLERAATYNYRTFAGMVLCAIGASLITLRLVVWH